MSYIPIPKPSILDNYEYLGRRNNQKLWRSHDKKRFFTWDQLHGDIEVFNKIGYHLGSIDPHNGNFLKEAVKGRRIDVS